MRKQTDILLLLKQIKSLLENQYLLIYFEGVSYQFNSYYIRKHHQIHMIAEEHTTTSKNMISFKSIIIGLILFVPMIAGVLIYQNSAGVNFPLGLFFPCLCLTLVNLNFARKQKFRDYFVHRVRQLKWRLPSCLVRPLRSRVAPIQDIEMATYP